jgi:hypothetical protein
MQKKKNSFATTYNEVSKEFKTDIDSVAKILAASWGDVPLRINDTRAMEIHLLAKAYLKLKKRK